MNKKFILESLQVNLHDVKLGSGDACLYSQYLGGRGRQISVNSRPAWSTRVSCRTGTEAVRDRETLPQKTKKERKKVRKRMT